MGSGAHSSVIGTVLEELFTEDEDRDEEDSGFTLDDDSGAEAFFIFSWPLPPEQSISTESPPRVTVNSGKTFT